jgi:nitrite reductase/ring-hydroxylating ferredoxin subunit
MRNLKLYIFFLLFSAPLFLNSCSKGINPEASTAIPNVSVHLSININSSPYTTLLKVGGVAYASGGYRGLLLYRRDANTIMAYDRTCSYNLSDANGIVDSQTNGTGICLACGSTYNLYNGNVNTGPSTIGIKSYATSFNSGLGTLTVTN